MTKELFLQLTNSAQIGTALLIIAVALWIIAARLLNQDRRRSRSSKG